jgi:hypothetical protein
MLGIEKRERDRIILSLPIEYYRINSDFRSIGYLQQADTLNASGNGLMVISRNKFAINSDVRVMKPERERLKPFRRALSKKDQ